MTPTISTHCRLSVSVGANNGDLLFCKVNNEELIVVANSPEVEFCGYSIPHPSEAKMNVRIQTYGMTPLDFHGSGLVTFIRNADNKVQEGTTVYDALEKGFDDLADLCDVVEERFTKARDEFMAKERA